MKGQTSLQRRRRRLLVGVDVDVVVVVVGQRLVVNDDRPEVVLGTRFQVRGRAVRADVAAPVAVAAAAAAAARVDQSEVTAGLHNFVIELVDAPVRVSANKDQVKSESAAFC